MDPTPPKGSRSRKFVNRPFYESTKKTSAEIISEARSTVRTLHTKRPETPLDAGKRTLFGKSREGRPPSAVSIASSYNESRPPTGKTRLTPLNNMPDFSELESKLEQKFANHNNNSQSFNRHENNNNNDTKPKKNKIQIRDNIIPQSAEPSFSRIRKSREMRKSSACNDDRRVQSGPKERTQPVFTDPSGDDLQRSSSYSDLTTIQSDESIPKESSIESLSNESASNYYKLNVEPLVKQMELNHLHEDSESIVTNFDMLWKTLEIGNMLGKNGKLPSKKRSELLSVVYKCIKDGSPLLELKLCKLFLAMEVTGKNLDVALKLMFQVSRNKNNDHIFIQEKLIDPLLKIMTSPEKHNIIDSLVYLAGTVKFLSVTQSCLQEMIQNNVLSASTSLLQFIKNKMSGDSQSNKESCHVLVQISSALSHFAEVTTLVDQFIENDILQILIDLMKTRMHDAEYVNNISRTFSKLSISEKMCKNISKQESNVGVLMNALMMHYKKQETAVRMCYAFGNMANHVLKFRHLVVYSSDGIKNLPKIVVFYLKTLHKARSKQKGKTEIGKDEEDVIIKTIRVIANLCITEDCAIKFANTEEWIQTLLTILAKYEELDLTSETIINTAATINNMSFYAQPNSALVKSSHVFTEAFMKLLLLENNDCQMEAMRALGNFTQSENSRQILVKKKGLELIIVLLDSCDIDMVFCTCGVLVNMMVDQPTRILFKQHHGESKLVELLKSVGDTDWSLVGLICQILWNYTERMNSSKDFFCEVDADDLMTTLNDFIDPEVALPHNNELNDSDEESWMEFLPIGQTLLERMERCHSSLEPIVTPPD